MQLEKAQGAFAACYELVADEGGADAMLRQLEGGDELRHLDLYAGQDLCFFKHFERAHTKVDMGVDADEAALCEFVQVDAGAAFCQVEAVLDFNRAEALRQQLVAEREGLRDGEQDMVRKGRIAVKLAHYVLVAAEGEIKLVVLEHFNEHIRACFGHGDVDVGVEGVELGDVGRQQISIHIMRAANLQITAFEAVDIINLLLELLLEQHFFFDMLQIQLADAREGERPLAAVEDGRAYFLLHLFDGDAQRRLGDEQCFSRFGKAAALVDLIDVFFF